MSISTITATNTNEGLDASQEVALRQTWLHLLQICGVAGANNAGVESAPLHLLSSRFSQCLDGTSPEEIRHGLWSFIMSEDPDALVLRFLRARRWDVENALTMLISAILWRRDRQLEELVIGNGENVVLEEQKGRELSVDERAFIDQYRSGKSYVRGVDRENRPVYVIKVRLHDPHKQSAQAMEQYILHNIESMRMLMRPPDDKCCVLFDMTGFGLRNMDFHVVKFLATVFEARYPETLGLVLIHNAPFVFWGLWKIIKGLLDPVVVSKINFTSGMADLLKWIPKEQLQTGYGGADAWEYQYVAPIAGENSRLEQREKRAEIQKEHDALIRELEAKTIQWASSDAGTAVGMESTEQRSKVKGLLEMSYWQLDPYIRARTHHQRVGIVDSDGHVNFGAARN